MPLVFEKDNAIADLRKLMGATNPANAEEGTIRKKFAGSIEENAIHARCPRNRSLRDRLLLRRIRTSLGKPHSRQKKKRQELWRFFSDKNESLRGAPLSGSERAFRPQAPCLEIAPASCGSWQILLLTADRRGRADSNLRLRVEVRRDRSPI